MKKNIIMFLLFIVACNLSAQCDDISNNQYNAPYVDRTGHIILGQETKNVYVQLIFKDQDGLLVPISEDSIFYGKTLNKGITIDRFSTIYSTKDSLLLFDYTSKNLGIHTGVKDSLLTFTYEYDFLMFSDSYNHDIVNPMDFYTGLQINFNIEGQGSMILIANFGRVTNHVILSVPFQPGIFRIRRCPGKYLGYLERDDSLPIIREEEKLE